MNINMKLAKDIKMILDKNLEKDGQYLLSSLSKALEVLDLISRYDGLRAVDISKKLSLNSTSTFKMLYTLEKYRYINKTEDSKYRLGIKFIIYGSLAYRKIHKINSNYCKKGFNGFRL